MANGHSGGFSKFAREIRKEVARQLRGFPKDELRGQLFSGWDDEFAHQLFGTPRRRRNRGRSR